MRLLALALLPLLLAGTACSTATKTRVGDLGRPIDPVSTGTVPQSRYVVDAGPGHFNRTDEEDAMTDRVWRFLHAPHVVGWFIPRLPRDPVPGEEDDKSRYYRWLAKTNYRSSHVRYNTVAGDITADVETLPKTFEAICAVEDIDRQRQVALAEIANAEPTMIERVAGRRAENGDAIQSFVVAVRYRYESYGYALDNLLIETPHEEAVEVDGLLNTMARFVERAERGDFCSRTATVQLVLPTK